MRIHRSLALLIATGVSASCTEVADPASLDAPDLTVAADHMDGLYKVHGNGDYVITLGDGTEIVSRFDMNVLQTSATGGARGTFRHRLTFFGDLVDFSGVVTCMTVDPIEGRAWIGGVIHKNRSVRESFATGEIFQPGKDIWFRVLDGEVQGGIQDRSTFVGFEGGAGIITSAEYCDTRPWPDANARTNPVVRGRLALTER